MNILLLTNTMKQPDDEFRAKTDVVFSFAREWNNAGHRVVVIHNEVKFPLLFYKFPSFVYSFLQKKGNVSIPSVKSRERLKRNENGIWIYRIPMLKLVPHSRYFHFQYTKQIRLIREYLREIDFIPDVITGHWLEPQLVLVHELGQMYRAKTGFVFHGDIPQSLSEKYKQYIQHLNCLFLRSNTTKKNVLSLPGNSFLPDRVSICYSGIPDVYLSKKKERTDWCQDNTLRILYVGRLVRYKRIDAILKTIAEISDRVRCVFSVVGEGTEKDNLLQMCKDLNLTENVTFHGMIHRDAVQQMMAQNDCFIMISENEVFGLVYLEAMAAGCITVASANGGVDGIIIDNENGFLCKQGDSTDLARILLKIRNLKNEELETIRENAYRTVQDYTDSKVAERYLNDIIS